MKKERVLESSKVQIIILSSSPGEYGSLALKSGKIEEQRKDKTCLHWQLHYMKGRKASRKVF
jgi:hypothetical protein